VDRLEERPQRADEVLTRGHGRTLPAQSSESSGCGCSGRMPGSAGLPSLSHPRRALHGRGSTLALRGFRLASRCGSGCCRGRRRALDLVSGGREKGGPVGRKGRRLGAVIEQRMPELRLEGLHRRDHGRAADPHRSCGVREMQLRRGGDEMFHLCAVHDIRSVPPAPAGASLQSTGCRYHLAARRSSHLEFPARRGSLG
jgi:hypothetical protein